MSESQYFQKGFNLKKVVGPVLAQNYASAVVERLKNLGYAARAGDLTLKLAREFGFCYGVDRAVEYAYETREKFPDRRIFLSGEIIHNPDVNGRIERLGIRILPEAKDPLTRYAEVRRGRRGDPARLRGAGDGDGAPAGQGLRARGHHLRQRAQRLEERPQVRPRGLHRGDPRQALPRGDEGHRLPGPDLRGRPLPLRARPRGGPGRLRLHPRPGRRRARSWSASRTRAAPASIPPATSSASASPTRPPCS